jgi:CubicO group peptidase (beta-lactamase class C family)
MENWEIETIQKVKKLFFLLGVLLISGCVTDSPLNLSFTSLQPREIGDGLIISNPSAENMDSLGLDRIYQEVFTDDNLWSLRSLLIFRNGNLVSEAYLKDEDDITNRHLIWSCTKQVMGILAGIAIDHGLIDSLDSPISLYFTDELDQHADKAGITIRDLLTMRSGIGFSNDGASGETDKLLRQIPESSVDFILSLPMEDLPGSNFHYKDGDPHLLSAILQKRAGKPTDIWADEVLFSTIGFRNYNWVRYKDGITFGGFGIETTPRELGKIALFVADSGRWDNQQLVPKEWISQMTASGPDTGIIYDFGFYWWSDPVRDIHFMWGHGGQFAFVIPSKELVVVMTSIPNTQGNYEIPADDALLVVEKIMNLAF